MAQKVYVIFNFTVLQSCKIKIHKCMEIYYITAMIKHKTGLHKIKIHQLLI